MLFSHTVTSSVVVQAFTGHEFCFHNTDTDVRKQLRCCAWLPVVHVEVALMSFAVSAVIKSVLPVVRSWCPRDRCVQTPILMLWLVSDVRKVVLYIHMLMVSYACRKNILCHFHITVEEETWQHLNNESSNKDQSINKWIDSSIHLWFLWHDASKCSVTQRCCSRGLNSAKCLFKSATDVGRNETFCCFVFFALYRLPESNGSYCRKDMGWIINSFMILMNLFHIFTGETGSLCSLRANFSQKNPTQPFHLKKGIHIDAWVFIWANLLCRTPINPHWVMCTS